MVLSRVKQQSANRGVTQRKAFGPLVSTPLSGEPFSFRYVSFQKGAHKAPEFQALSRWEQVPVLVDDGCVRVQATAIVEHLAETLGRFQGDSPDPD